MTPRGIVKLRRSSTVHAKSSSTSETYCLTVPVPVARQLEPLLGALFYCELTEDVILFRPAFDDNADAVPPKWVTQ